MIKGTTIMPLEKVIDTYCNHGDFYINKVEHMEPTFSKEELEKVQNSFKKDIEILKQIKLKSKEAVSLCDSLTNESRKNIASNTIDNQLKKLEKINQYILEQSVYDLMNFYVSAAAAHYISKMYRFTDNMEDNSIQTYQRSKYIFKAIIEASEYIKPKLISAFYDEN